MKNEKKGFSFWLAGRQTERVPLADGKNYYTSTNK